MRSRKTRGFTLIEMMVVVVILGLLASVVTVKVYQHIRRAKITKAKLEVNSIVQAIKFYKMDSSKIPESLEDLLEKTKAHPEGLLPAIPKDPWGNDYGFYPDDEHEYVVVSYGADGQEGGEDENADILSYELEGEASDSETGETEQPAAGK